MIRHQRSSRDRPRGLPFGSEASDLIVRRRNLIEALDRCDSRSGLATMTRAEHLEQPISRDVSVARGLLDREGLLQMLDRAASKRVTMVSAPPGSGKTSLLRAWAARSAKLHRVAFVSVDRDQQDAQRFWSTVLEAIRSAARPIGPETQRVAIASLDADQMVDKAVSEFAEQVEPVVLVIDDLHELRSAGALAQLEHLLATAPSSARVVLSSRRDPPFRLHRLRLADEVAEIRAGDLRFTERETRELLDGSGIRLSDGAAAALYQRTEGWAAGLRLAVISLAGHPDPERFVAEFSGTDRAIGEYLMAEMLERQPSEVQSMLLRTSLVDRVNGELADLLAGRSGSEQMLLELEEPTRSSCRSMLSGRGFATTSCSRIFCAWNSAERWPPRCLICIAGPHGGSLTTGLSSRRCDTCSPRATGLMPPGSSRITRSGGCSTGKRERSTRCCRRFPRKRRPTILTWR